MIKAQPIVQIDSREQVPLRIQAYPVEIVGLPVGDYGIRGFSDWSNPRFINERKTLNDLIGSLTSGHKRFMAEIEKLRQFTFAAILVEGLREQIEAGDYRSRATPQSILAMLDAIEVRTGIHVVWCGTADEAARRLEAFVRQFVRGIEKDARRLEAGPPE